MEVGSSTANFTVYQNVTSLAVFPLDSTPFGAAVNDSIVAAATPISSTGTEVAGKANTFIFPHQTGDTVVPGGTIAITGTTSIDVVSGNLLSLQGVQGISMLSTSQDILLTAATDVQLTAAGSILLDGATGVFHDYASGDIRVGYAATAAMSAITTRTNSTTALTGASGTAFANTWNAGTAYRFSGMLNGTRGATATAANVVFRVVVSGTSEASAVLTTTVANGANFTCWVEGYVTCITTGSSGTAIAVIRFAALNNATVNVAGSTGIATFTLNTTVNNTLALTAEFSAAVADLSMTWQGANIMRVAF